MPYTESLVKNFHVVVNLAHTIILEAPNSGQYCSLKKTTSCLQYYYYNIWSNGFTQAVSCIIVN